MRWLFDNPFGIGPLETLIHLDFRCQLRHIRDRLSMPEPWLTVRGIFVYVQIRDRRTVF